MKTIPEPFIKLYRSNEDTLIYWTEDESEPGEETRYWVWKAGDWDVFDPDPLNDEPLALNEITQLYF